MSCQRHTIFGEISGDAANAHMHGPAACGAQPKSITASVDHTLFHEPWPAPAKKGSHFFHCTMLPGQAMSKSEHQFQKPDIHMIRWLRWATFMLGTSGPSATRNADCTGAIDSRTAEVEHTGCPFWNPCRTFYVVHAWTRGQIRKAVAADVRAPIFVNRPHLQMQFWPTGQSLHNHVHVWEAAACQPTNERICSGKHRSCRVPSSWCNTLPALMLWLRICGASSQTKCKCPAENVGLSVANVPNMPNGDPGDAPKWSCRHLLPMLYVFVPYQDLPTAPKCYH